MSVFSQIEEMVYALSLNGTNRRWKVFLSYLDYIELLTEKNGFSENILRDRGGYNTIRIYSCNGYMDISCNKDVSDIIFLDPQSGKTFSYEETMLDISISKMLLGDVI